MYEAGRIAGNHFSQARWDLLPKDRYMWASVQTVRGCPKHCSFCSVWRTDGQQPRQANVEAVVGEIVALRRQGFRFIALADDNFYPVSLADLAQARRRADPARLRELEAIRAERFALMERLERLPEDMVFFTQITMEAAEDPEFMAAMKRAHIKGALVGVESVTAEGLKDVYKGFNLHGEALVERLQAFRTHGIHVLGSFIFGLPSDRPATFATTAELADRAGVTFAQFVMLTPYPGTVDFERWEKDMGEAVPRVGGIPGLAALVDSPGAAAQGLHAAPGDGSRRDPAPHAGGVGRVLLAAAHLAALPGGALSEGAPGLLAHLEAVPADVREHRDRHRLGPTRAVGQTRTSHGESLPALVHRSARCSISRCLRPQLRRLRSSRGQRELTSCCRVTPCSGHSGLQRRSRSDPAAHAHGSASRCSPL